MRGGTRPPHLRGPRYNEHTSKFDGDNIWYAVQPVITSSPLDHLNSQFESWKDAGNDYLTK